MHKRAGFHQLHAEGRSHQLRRRVAIEAARLMSEHGIRDFRMAKRKAAEHVGVAEGSCLPDNREIEAALREHQRLFRGAEQPRALHARRLAAREAMRLLAPFDARLAGAVLEGTADANSTVELHVFHDSTERVVNFLHDRGIDCTLHARSVRLDRQRSAELPVLGFEAGGIAIAATVFPHDALRQAPLNPIDERPQPRASLPALEALLAETPAGG